MKIGEVLMEMKALIEGCIGSQLETKSQVDMVGPKSDQGLGLVVFKIGPMKNHTMAWICPG